VEWKLPSGKVRKLLQALVVALALYGCLRWAGFYEFTNRDAEGLATITQLLGDIYAVLAGRDSSLAARRDDWKNARAAYARAADEYRSLIGVPGGERYARQLSETERLVADCDRRLK